MGTLRLLLALLVAAAHLVVGVEAATGSVRSSAIFAVKAFFIMSGFYMALVLDTGYRNRPVRDFYASRALRLLPPYWFISIATIIAARAVADAGGHFYPLLEPILYWRPIDARHIPVGAASYLGVSLTTLLGADTWLWLGFNPVSGAFSVAPNYDYGHGATSGLALTVVPQAWTIGIEILFYLLAPFLVARRLMVLLAVAAGSLVFRAALAYAGLGGYPWSRALLPSELIFFVAGIIGYRLYVKLRPRQPARAWSWAALAAAFGVVLAVGPYILRRGDTPLIGTVPYVCLAILIPFAFTATRGNRVDAYLGNLAYPVYMVHLMMYGIIQHTLLKSVGARLGSEWGWLLFNLALVLLAAAVVELVAVRPIDQIRVRFGARAASRPIERPAPPLAHS